MTETPADTLRRAATMVRELAVAATPGPWRLGDTAAASEVWADRDPAGWDAFMVATTETRLNPHPGVRGHTDAAHIAAWSPPVALAVADWLEEAADHVEVAPADGTCNAAAVAVARALLGEDS